MECTCATCKNLDTILDNGWRKCLVYKWHVIEVDALRGCPAYDKINEVKTDKKSDEAFKKFVAGTAKYGIKIKIPTDKEVKEKLDEVLKNG